MERNGNSRIAWAIVSWALNTLALALLYLAGVMTSTARRIRAGAGYANQRAFS